jgi:hypothetical protein
MRTALRLIAGAALVAAVDGCQKTESPVGVKSVVLDLTVVEQQAQGEDESLTTWLAFRTYGGDTASLLVEMLVKPLPEDSAAVFTEGTFFAAKRSPKLLKDIGRVLRAANADDIIAKASKTDEVPYRAAISGENLSRNPQTGYFVMRPAGGWLTTKVFIGPKNSEFNINIDTEGLKLEINPVGAEFGNGVLAELAKVL